jgi:hypothetical protein
MKKFLIILIFNIFCSNQSYAKTFLWTCLKSETKDFQLVFKINDGAKTIEHLSSYNFSIKKKFDVFRKDVIIEFNKDNAWSSTPAFDSSRTMRFFDFKNGYLYQTAIQPTSKLDEFKYSNLTWNCYKSD